MCAEMTQLLIAGIFVKVPTKAYNFSVFKSVANLRSKYCLIYMWCTIHVILFQTMHGK